MSRSLLNVDSGLTGHRPVATGHSLFSGPNERRARLCFWPFESDGGDRTRPPLLLGAFSCDVPDFSRDRNGLERIRGGELF